MNKRLGVAILAAIIIAAGIGVYALLQLVPMEITQPSETQYSQVTVRAIDQNNNPLSANVTVSDSEGVTPFNITLRYGTYTFTAVYQNFTVQKTLEINQPNQEVVIQFEIPNQSILEISASDLTWKIHTGDLKIDPGTVLRVSGRVQTWSLVDESGNVLLWGDDFIRKVACNFHGESAKAIKDLKSGDEVVIQGTFDHTEPITGSVILENCTLVLVK